MIFNRSFSLSVLVLTTVFLSCRAGAQISTQDWINDGRNKLKLQTPQALQQAEASFREALKRDPNNAEANVLRVGARLALEIQTPEVIALLTDFGCTDIQANTYNWLFTAPQDADGRLKPRDDARSDALLGYLAARETLVNELLGGLEKVTNENFRIVLTAEETSTTPVHIDYADVCILRAIFYLGKAIQAFGSSYNLSAEYALFYRLFVDGKLNPQEVQTALPNLLKFVPANRRPEAREHLRKVNANFQTAFSFLAAGKRINPYTRNYAFSVSEDTNFTVLRQVFTTLANGLNGRVQLPAALGQSTANELKMFAGRSINFAPLFTSSTPLRSLMPTRFDRGFYRRDSWPDSTFGGVLPGGGVDLLNYAGAALRIVQWAFYEPYELSLVAGSQAPPPYSYPSVVSRPFANIVGMAVDSKGSLILADAGFNVVRRLSADGRLTTIAGIEWTTPEQRDLLLQRTKISESWNQQQYPPLSHLLGDLAGVAVDKSDNIYFVSQRRIMKLTAGGNLSVLAGSSTNWGTSGVFDGIGGNAIFTYPSSLTVDSLGNVYVVDDGKSIRKVTPQGAVSTLAGVAGWSAPSDYVDAVGSRARFGWISGSIGIDATGKIYVADVGNHRIRTITTSGPSVGKVETFMGGGAWFHYDGPRAQAEGDSFLGVAVDSAGSVLFTDNKCVRKIGSNGQVVTILGKPYGEEFNDLMQGVGERVVIPSGWPFAPTLLVGDAQGQIYLANYRSVWRARSVSSSPPAPLPTPTPFPTPGPNSGPLWPVPIPVPTPLPQPNPTPTPVNDPNPPVLLSVSASPFSFNPSGSGSAVPIELIVQDVEKSRLSSCSITFVNSSDPEQRAYAYFSSQNLIRIQGAQGDQFSYRGNWSSDPAGTGDWVIDSLWISDNAGNSANYSRNYGAPIPQALSGVIFRTGSSFPIYTPLTDSVAPRITSITVTPTAVDLSTGRKTVTVRLQITDNVSGLQWGNITFQSGDFYEALSAGPFDLVNGSYTNGTYEVKLSVPTGTRNGQWRISNLWIQDRAGNERSYATWNGSLAPALQKTFTVSGGGQANPAALTSAAFSASSVDTLAGPASIKFRFEVANKSPALDSWFKDGTLGIKSPSGTQYLWTDFDSSYVVSTSGSKRTYEVLLNLPQYSEGGIWSVDYIEVKGADYNEPSRYFLPANFTPWPTFSVQGVSRRWQEDVLSAFQPAEKTEIPLYFGDLSFLFDGAEKRATAFSPDFALDAANIVFTYNGRTTAPIDIGTYQVVAYVDSPLFRGRSTATMSIMDAGQRVQTILGGGLYATVSGSMYYSAVDQEIGQLVREGLLLRDGRGNPLAASSFATLFGWMEQYGGAVGVVTSTPGQLRVALPNYFLPRRARVPVLDGVTVYTINRQTGRITATATLTQTKQLAAMLAAESEFNMDFNRDELIGDVVRTDLGAGLYATVSGSMYYSAVDQEIGELVREGLLLRDGRGNPLAASSFATLFGWMEQYGGAVGVVTSTPGQLRVALPNYFLPRRARVPVLDGVTVYTINRLTGRITATATLTQTKQLAAMLAAESEFNMDFNRDNDIGLLFSGPDGGLPIEVNSLYFGKTRFGYALSTYGRILHITNKGRFATPESVTEWAPVAAVVSGNGYEIFWKHTEESRFAQWILAADASVVSNAVLSAGQRRLAEKRLGLDINGDGTTDLGKPGVYMGSYTTNEGQTGGFAFVAREKVAGVAGTTGAAIAYTSALGGLATGVPDTPISPDGSFDALSVEGDRLQGTVSGVDVSGSFANSFTGGSGNFTGSRIDDSGPYTAGAGAYAGGFGGYSTGEAYAIAAADGRFYFYTVNQTTGETNGGFGKLDRRNSFSTRLSDGTTVSVTLNLSSKTITGAYFWGRQRLGSIFLSLQPD